MPLLEKLILYWHLVEAGFYCFLYKMKGVPRVEFENVVGKVVVITGAESGIGSLVAMKLANMGATILMGCKNMEEGNLTRDKIIHKTKSPNVHLFKLDLENFDSVRKFAKEIIEKFPKISILINNAGVCIESTELLLSPNGAEKHMCINHLGHFLLTNLLMEKIKQSSPSRIVTTSSTQLLFSKLDLNDLMLKKRKNPTASFIMPFIPISYNNSKMANSLMSKELGERLQGSGVTTVSFCPGQVASRLFGNFTGYKKWAIKLNSFFFGISVDQAADTLLYYTLAKKLQSESGKFYRFFNICSKGEEQIKKFNTQRFWKISEELVGINNEI